MEAYRRIAQSRDFTSLEQVRGDLAGAYGEPPKAVDRLLELAEVRLAAALLGVRSMLVRAPDVVFRTSKPKLLQQAFHGVKGTMRVVGEPDSSGDIQVYFRPPENYLEPASLAAVMRKRLLPAAKSNQ
jgi:transcription-repair coupling factor (superfamily II helicase)